MPELALLHFLEYPYEKQDNLVRGNFRFRNCQPARQMAYQFGPICTERHLYIGPSEYS